MTSTARDRPILATGTPHETSHAAPSDDDSLHLLARGITRMAGFQVAVISLVIGDEIEVVSVAGSPECAAALRGDRFAVSSILEELELADEWGPLRFIPHERLTAPPSGWIPDIEPIDHPDAWHPLDALYAPLRTDDGHLVGLLSIDVPDDGLRPDPARRRILAEYAEQVTHFAVLALERRALAERLRMATSARRAIRAAPAHLGLAEVLTRVRASLTEGFDADRAWFWIPGRGRADGALDLPDDIHTLAGHLAAEAREQDHVLVLPGEAVHNIFAGRAYGNASLTTGEMLVAPIGTNETLLGAFFLQRAATARPWSQLEQEAAVDASHDLSRLVASVTAFESERATVAELRELEEYRSRLVSTIAHEIGNPLAAITAHLEILDEVEIDPEVAVSLDSIRRNTSRITKVSDDLLLLVRVGNPGHPLSTRTVDLRRCVSEAADLVGIAASRKHQRLDLCLPQDPAATCGDADELDRMVANLVSNAVKYTPDGGTVRVSVTVHDTHVELAVSDSGIGMSGEDQAQLFEPFFRSTAPGAAAQPGTGLGLAIVQRIVQRHGGEIQVTSALGEGSTFVVTLPLAT
ncbi:sensor histidine kinase [Nocardioides acrostichi]|uniref:histidine kinase n=1 Tax=Nocardioides acrostichi TaxID=2784339 RepID=A0A930UYW5_9ACTN|nr:ATP-binding protein [Nocardioides acrostichi]MBF4162641.1 hypothetical protein [Nocardioides acrostichi]